MHMLVGKAGINGKAPLELLAAASVECFLALSGCPMGATKAIGPIRHCSKGWEEQGLPCLARRSPGGREGIV